MEAKRHSTYSQVRELVERLDTGPGPRADPREDCPLKTSELRNAR
jgi:hypothetical protein